MTPLRAGDPRVIGAYRLLGRLGSGGMGRVYLARSAGGRTVAVKVVHAEHAQDPQFRARFRREIASVRKVGEHYTAPVLDADPEADRPWVATGFVPGPSLEQVVQEHGPLPADSVLVLALGLLRALQGIHGAGILHRDLKPSNVMLTVEGPRVIDFGIARALEPSVESLLTSTGMVVGSPGFMAPEQVRGESLGPAADVFALGCVLLYAVTGRLPFGHGAGNQHAIMFQIVEAEPELDRVESEPLRAFLARCLIKDPAERPTIAALLADPALPGEESGRGPAAGGAWLPPELVARLARQAARLLDVEALSEELEREAATSGGASGGGEGSDTDTGTVGLRPKAPGTGTDTGKAPDTDPGPDPVGVTPVAVRREPRRASRIWTIVAAVFVVLGISGTVVKLIDDNARQRDLQGAPTTPGGTTAGPGTHSSAPPATTTTGPTSAPPPGTTATPPPGQQPPPGQAPPPADVSGGASGGSSGGSSGGGTQPRPPATATTSAPKPAPAPAPAKTTAPSSTGQVPSAFVGTWTYTSAYNIGQPKTVYVYRVAPGQIAARLITEINGAHCEHVAKLVSITDGGKRINLGGTIVDQARSSGYPSCTNGDASAFLLATPTGLTHDVGPAHGEGYHYHRA